MHISEGLSVFDTFRRSLELTKASFAVLRSDKELLVFPLVSFLALVVVTISFFVPFALIGGIENVSEGAPSIAEYVLAFIYYVVAYSVIFFFNTALVGAAMIRLEGGDPTLRDGIRIAGSHLPAIVGYAVIAATVGMILRAISERAGIVGQIIIGIIGFVWNVATFLVVPVLVSENVGPIEAIKRSASLLRKTWGEQIVASVGIGLVFAVLVMVVVAVGVLVIVAAASISAVLALVGVVVLVLAVGGVALVGSALSGIFTASLYRYATKGDGGPMFRSETLSAAFRPKGGGMAGRFGLPR
jgi:hypothetical protein